MCGISGAIGWKVEAMEAAVGWAHEALAHRGPDADGRWAWRDAGADRGVAMAHRRLSIIDLSADGNQPMVDPTTGNVIAFNGEIYNFAEVRDTLKQAGHTFRSRSDTEVLLKAYAAWGEACVEQLRGMFAFAIWDAAARSLFLARDRMGIKPLYYTTVQMGEGRALLFASEVRALLATEMIERRIDPVALESYLWNGYVVGPHTIVAGVRLLPAGSMMRVDLDGRVGEPASFPRPASENRPASVDDVHSELGRAVGMRMVADVPVGVFLSGGIDSSAVAALATERVGGDRVRTFNISFEESSFDESRYALAVAEALGTEHREIRLSESKFAERLDEALDSIDQPTFDAINTYFVSRAVQEAGVTVALAGTGGDELFGGYASFRDVPAASGYAKAASAAPAVLRRPFARAVTRWKTGKPGAVGPQTRWGKLEDVLATGGDLLALYQASYSLFTRRFSRELHESQCNGRLRDGLPADLAAKLYGEAIEGRPLSTISRFEQRLFLRERLLRDTDAASMAVALEVRVPLVDHAFVEAVERLDESQRFAPLGRKQVLRDIACRRIDPSVFARPKSGFVLPIERWCRQRLRPQLSASFGDESLCRSVGLNPAAVQRVWQAFEAGAPGIYWSRVWALFVLLNFCRKHQLSLSPSPSPITP